MKRYVIDSVESIQEFFTDLHLRTRQAVAAEVDLSELTDDRGSTIFSKIEADYLDNILLDCFVYCLDHHLDLDEIVEVVQQQLCFENSIFNLCL